MQRTLSPKPLQPTNRLSDKLEDLFPRLRPQDEFKYEPRLDIGQDDNMLVVKVELPGVSPEEMEVSVKEHILTISGEKKLNETDFYHHLERTFGKFNRQVVLSRMVDTDKISASNANGVLTVTIPKKPEVQPRKIEIKAQE